MLHIERNIFVQYILWVRIFLGLIFNMVLNETEIWELARERSYARTLGQIGNQISVRVFELYDRDECATSIVVGYKFVYANKVIMRVRGVNLYDLIMAFAFCYCE